jgi:Leucine-rich repeat (LRR) protein
MSELIEMKQFMISQNQIQSIPNLSNMVELVEIWINNNQINTIPDISQMKHLQRFSVGNNQINATIPAFSGLTQLRYIDLSKNYFQGQLDSFTAVTNLVSLDVHDNLLSGPLPLFTDSLHVQYLDFSNNGFSGSLPFEWAEFDTLETFLADHNLLESPADVLGYLNTVKYISLSNNQISSEYYGFDSAATVMLCQGLKTVSMDFSSNLISGEWPSGASIHLFVHVDNTILLFSFVLI